MPVAYITACTTVQAVVQAVICLSCLLAVLTISCTSSKHLTKPICAAVVVVLMENSDVYTFGSNQFGQLGVGDTTMR